MTDDNPDLTKMVEAIAYLDEEDMGIIVDCFKDNCDTLEQDCQAALEKAYTRCKKLCESGFLDPREAHQSERFQRLEEFRAACAEYLTGLGE